ncbi:MAG: hypothetical protein E5Y55_24085 [Mesorhizobium sp.]|uniref:hypothetical protein n=1 Tax=Mesorhizobium sp. TaxID=1871066 RepID=UPI001203448C|nr:hypothetical protein [Mesorhizobium sp.]TIM41761.1 MAG: hypothetical protein E5Y55_24085 [Mesorhizobium sp.]
MNAVAWGWLCNGKGDGWEERDKVVRDPELVARYRAQPDRWTVTALFTMAPGLAEPEAPDMVALPREPTREIWAAMGDVLVGHRNRHHDKVAADLYAAILGAAPARPE